MIALAVARGDSTRLGRMTYHRGRARLALRDPGAEGDFDRAIAIAEAVGDTVGRMHALGLKGFSAVNRGALDESIAFNEERVRLARATGHRGSEAWGHLLIGYAELYRENLARARAEYEEAWRAFGEVERPRLQLTALVGLGRTLQSMGRHDEARTSYQHAWLTAREINDPIQEADAINNLGVIEYAHGELSLAARYFDRAYHIKRDAKAFDLANAARNVAMIDLIIGRYAHAESTLVEASTLSSGAMLDAATNVELGRIRLAQGRVRGATPFFRRAIASTSSVKSRVEAMTFLGEALAQLDSVPAAVALVDTGFVVLASLKPSAWRADAFLEWSRRLRDAGSFDRARGAAQEAWSDATARADSTTMVMAAVELSLCERSRDRDAEAVAWLERAREGFEASPKASEFQWREAQRALLVRALIASGDVLRDFPPDASQLDRDRALFDFLQQVQARTLLERVTDPRRYDDADASLARPVSADELRGAMLPGECFFDATAGPGRIYVFAVTRNEIRSAVIDDPRGEVRARVRNYTRILARAPRDGDPRLPDTAARSLGELFFAPCTPLVRSATRVYASLDGYLSGLPIETLVCPGEDAPMIARREVVRIPAAAWLRYLRAREARAPAESSLLAVSSGGGDLAGAEREAARLAARYGAARAVEPDREEFLAALSGRDVIHIAAHVRVDSQRPWHSGVLIGSDRAGAAAAPGATRSAAVPDPLALSAADSSEMAASLPRDPFVRASEIAARRLDARLVVLSGCESALGRATLAEGVLGIASAFVCAGGRAVVASLWEVDDRTTADLMERFYRELASGRTVVSALQAAQLELRGRKPHPFFWAGFVVIGDGDVAVRLREGPERPAVGMAALLAGLTVLLITGWAFRRRRATIRA
jgi:tetratricopeptide (TPR) repeat protein